MDDVAAVDARLLNDWGAAFVAVKRVSVLLYARVMRDTGLPRPAAEALLRLAMKSPGSMAMSELARASDYTAGGMSKLADRLAAVGLVERVAQPDDRRVVMLTLTPEGWDAVRRVQHSAAEALRTQVVARVGEEVFAQFIVLASELRDQIGDPT